jgi:hypothetical protein
VPVIEWAGSGVLNIADVSNKAKRTKEIDLTVTGDASYSTVMARAHAVADSAGRYRLIGNIIGTVNGSDGTLTLTGVTFKSTAAGQHQAITIFDTTSTGAGYTAAFASQGTNTIGWYTKTTNAVLLLSFNVVLESKPTWFDANVETNDWQPVGFGLATQNSAGLVSPSVTTSGVVYAGTYTPTLTGVSNVDSVTLQGTAKYLRLGNIVHVCFRTNIDPTSGAPTGTSFRCTLPIASDFTAISQLNGTGCFNGGRNAAIASADTTNNAATIEFQASFTGEDSGTVNFTYEIV